MMDKAIVIQVVLLLAASSTGLGLSQDKPNIGRPNDLELIAVILPSLYAQFTLSLTTRTSS